MISAFLAGEAEHPGRWEGDEPDHDERPRLADFLLALAISAVLWAPVVWLLKAMWP